MMRKILTIFAAFCIVLMATGAFAQQPTQVVSGSNANNVFPANTAAADGVANPSLTQIGSFPYLYNGTTWDRWRGDSSGGAWVTVKNATLAVTQSGTWSTRTQDGSGNNLTSALRGSQQALSVQVVDGSGNQVTSFGGAGGTASNYGSAFPSSGTATGFYDGTNMQGPRVFDLDTGAGTQYVAGVDIRFGGSGGSAEWATAAANIPKVGITDGSGNAVTSTSNALDINIKGCTSGVCSATSTNVVTGTTVEAIVEQDAAITSSATLQSSAVANGNGTAKTVTGEASAVLTVNCSSCSGGTTVNFEGSEDTSNFVSINATQLGTNTIASSTTTSGITVWKLDVANFQTIRARISGYSAGTITVTAHVSPIQIAEKTVNANLVAGTANIGNVRVTDLTNFMPTMDAVSRPGFQKITDGTNTRILDPCESSGATISYIAISQTANTVIKAGTSAKKTYVCSINIVAAAAENVSIVGGTGSTCGTNTVAIFGGTTAANGWNFAANGGIAMGNGSNSLASTTVNADDLCIIQAGSVRLGGNIKVAVQ